MSLPDPQTVRAELWAVLDALQKAEDVLEPSSQRNMADRLVPVYNYVSEQVDQRGATNLLWKLSARDARQRETLSVERQALEQHKSFVERTFDSAEKHFKTVQLAGYAVFFAIWGFTRQWMFPAAEALAALLMILSATLFVAWEIYKSSTLAAVLRKHARISSQGIDHFLTSRPSAIASKGGAISFFSRARVWVWFLCVTPAVCALGIMVVSIVVHLINVSNT